VSTVEGTSGGEEVRDLGLAERVGHLANEANPAFAAVCVVVPLALTAVGYALDLPRVLFYAHLATGALWFAVAIFMAVVVGPALGSLSDGAAAEFDAAITPKTVWFVFGTSLGTVVSGTLLLEQLYGLTATFWGQVALGFGWLLWLFGLVVPNRLHLKTYYLRLAGDDAPDRMARLERRTMVVGLVETALMLAIVFVMTRIRLG
jgi:hypothetical protein